MAWRVWDSGSETTRSFQESVLRPRLFASFSAMEKEGKEKAFK